MANLVIGAVMNYDYAKIEPWLVSLKRTGYEGNIALIAYQMDKATIDKLSEKGVVIYALALDDQGNATYPRLGNKDFNIMVERFAHIWHFLSNLDEDQKPEFVYVTDVGDVIFQANPDEYINAEEGTLYWGNELIIGGENLKYKDEPWSARNMDQAFGPVFLEKMKDQEIYCAGAFVGDYQTVTDLCQTVFLICRGSATHTYGGGGPDQAALNIILRTSPWEDFVQNSDVFANLGTHSEAIKAGAGDIGLNYKLNNISPFENFLRKEVIIEKTGDKYVIKTTQDDIVPIVHQYNRIPYLKEYFEKEFRE